jgi:hypothetical protein
MTKRELVRRRSASSPCSNTSTRLAATCRYYATNRNCYHNRSGSPDDALPYEPRPSYHPTNTTLTERHEFKINELNNEFAERTGEKMADRTICRLQVAQAPQCRGLH